MNPFSVFLAGMLFAAGVYSVRDGKAGWAFWFACMCGLNLWLGLR